MPFGFGLVFTACKLILRFSSRYYSQHQAAYTSSQKTLITNLINAANAIVAAIQLSVGP